MNIPSPPLRLRPNTSRQSITTVNSHYNKGPSSYKVVDELHKNDKENRSLQTPTSSDTKAYREKCTPRRLMLRAASTTPYNSAKVATRGKNTMLTRPVLSDRRKPMNYQGGLNDKRLTYLLDTPVKEKGCQEKGQSEIVKGFLSRMEQQREISARKMEALRRDLEPCYESIQRHKGQRRSTSLYDRGKDIIKERECRLEERRRQLEAKQLQQCTFRPHTSRARPSGMSSRITPLSLYGRGSSTPSTSVIRSTRYSGKGRYSRCDEVSDFTLPTVIMDDDSITSIDINNRIEELEAIALTDRSLSVYPESDRDHSEAVIDYILEDDDNPSPQRIHRGLSNKWMTDQQQYARIPQFKCVSEISDFLVDNV